MSYAALPYAQRPSDPDYYSHPHQTGHAAHGAYGRDGAPPSKFIRPVVGAYRPPAPRRPNIAPAERNLPQSRLHHGVVGSEAHPPYTRRSPSPVPGYNPRSYTPTPAYPSDSSPPLPPMYQDTGGQYHHRGHDVKLQTPHPVFVEPKQKSSMNMQTNGSLTHGRADSGDKSLNEKPPTTFRELTDGEEVWKRIGRELKAKPDDTWLSRQAAAGSRFKCGAWIVAVVVLTLIVGSVAYIVLRRSTPSAPSALSWANGAKEVPTFGSNSTTSLTSPANNQTGQVNRQNLAASRASNRLRARKHTHHLFPQLD